MRVLFIKKPQAAVLAVVCVISFLCAYRFLTATGSEPAPALSPLAPPPIALSRRRVPPPDTQEEVDARLEELLGEMRLENAVADIDSLDGAPITPPTPIKVQHSEVQQPVVRCDLGVIAGSVCEMRNALVMRPDGSFVVPASPDISAQLFPVNPNNRLDRLAAMNFNISLVEELPVCDEVFNQPAFIFPFNYRGSANLWHMYTDTLMSLFYLFERQNLTADILDNSADYLLIPSVVDTYDRVTHLPGLTWNTDAFNPPVPPSTVPPFWVQQLELMAVQKMRPLIHSNWVADHQFGNRCFNNVIIGNIDQTRAGTQGSSLLPTNPNNGFLERFISFIRHRAHVPDPAPPSQPRVGIISRHSDTRLILNEKELAEIVQSQLGIPCDLITFETMTVKDQIAKVGQYTVLAGMNGAGLTNALFLPRCSTAIQLSPYGQVYLNVRSFTAFLKCRRNGGNANYIFWENKHENMTQRHSVYSAEQSSTRVHPIEWKDLVVSALKLNAQECAGVR